MILPCFAFVLVLIILPCSFKGRALDFFTGLVYPSMWKNKNNIWLHMHFDGSALQNNLALVKNE